LVADWQFDAKCLHSAVLYGGVRGQDYWKRERAVAYLRRPRLPINLR
jgi:hypothetical protein